MKKSILIFACLVYGLLLEAQYADSVAVLISQYEYQKAVQLIESLELSDPEPELLYLKGLALKGLSQYQDAVEYFKKAHEADTANIQYAVELSQCYNTLTSYPEAQRILNNILKLNPDDQLIQQQLAGSYFLGDNYQQAKQRYLRIYQSDSSYYFTRQIAICYDRLNIRDSAILYYEKTLAFNPDDLYSVFRMGTLCKDTKRYADGMQITEQYLKRDTSDININLLNGYFYYLASDFPTAADRFLRCVRLEDSSLFVHKYLGYSYFKLEQYNGAIPYLEKAFRQDTADSEISYVLGLACDYADDKTKAISYYGKTIELIEPAIKSLSQVYQDMASSYTMDFQYEKALETYIRAHELIPGDTLLLYRIASHYDNWLRDKSQALEYYRKFMLTSPRKSAPSSTPELSPYGLVLSYYDFVERRIRELEEEIRNDKMKFQVLPFYVARNEIDTLLRILSAIHPTFDKLPNVKQLIAVRDTLKGDLTVHEYFKILQPLVTVDGHTTLQFTGTIFPEIDNPYFPFEVVALNDSLYIKKNLSNDPFIKPGTKIISINRQDPGGIIRSLLPYMPGERIQFKLRSMEGNGFANYYRLVYGNYNHFELALQNGNTNYTVSVPGIDRSRFQERDANPLYFKILNDSIGYYKVGRFINTAQFMSYTDSVFAVVKLKDIRHLIIDKTRGGGFGDLADSLLSYFTTRPYRSFERKMVRISTETSEYIQENRHNGEIKGDYFVITPELKMPVKRNNHYDGKVYILTGPTAYSAATMFVAMAKCYSDAVILGEETGQPLISNGDLSRHELSLSRLNLYTSHSTYYMPCYDNEHDGVKPDIEISMTLEDLLFEKNPYLDYALQLIKTGH